MVKSGSAAGKRKAEMKRQQENGQAITEFVVCMMGILFVFLGLLAVSILSMENVRCVIDSRSEIDVKAEMGTSFGGKSPRNIMEWNSGDDGIPFTGDDKPSGSMPFYTYADHFNTGNDTLISSGVAGTENPPLIRQLTLFQIGDRGYADSDRINTTFLGAANLSGSTVTVTDPLSRRGLPELQNLLRYFTGNSVQAVEDTVYMPARTE